MGRPTGTKACSLSRCTRSLHCCVTSCHPSDAPSTPPETRRLMSHYPRRVPTLLDPIDRVSEILFGLIMVLTFTGSLSVAESGRAEIREMFVGAVGCNLAWGLIDAIFYLMGCLA